MYKKIIINIASVITIIFLWSVAFDLVEKKSSQMRPIVANRTYEFEVVGRSQEGKYSLVYWIAGGEHYTLEEKRKKYSFYIQDPPRLVQERLNAELSKRGDTVKIKLISDNASGRYQKISVYYSELPGDYLKHRYYVYEVKDGKINLLQYGARNKTTLAPYLIDLLVIDSVIAIIVMISSFIIKKKLITGFRNNGSTLTKT